MSFSLFEDENQALADVNPDPDVVAQNAKAVIAPATVHEPVKEPSLPEKVAADYQYGLDAAIAAIAELTEPMRAFYGRGFTPFEESFRKLPCSNSLNKEMFELIVKDAKKTGLAAPGDYHFDAVFGEYLTGLNRHRGFGEDNTVKVDIVGLCNAIFDKYAGDAGDTIEHKRVANELISTFRLKDFEIQPKAGYVTLAHHIYLEKKYGGGYQLSYSYHNTLRNAMRDLAHVFAQQSLDFELNELHQFMTSWSERVEPNKTTFTGSVGDQTFTVKAMKDQFRWKFPEACIAVISDFVAEYGSND